MSYSHNNTKQDKPPKAYKRPAPGQVSIEWLRSLKSNLVCCPEEKKETTDHVIDLVLHM